MAVMEFPSEVAIQVDLRAAPPNFETGQAREHCATVAKYSARSPRSKGWRCTI